MVMRFILFSFLGGNNEHGHERGDTAERRDSLLHDLVKHDDSVRRGQRA
jgi:hypothetical protein